MKNGFFFRALTFIFFVLPIGVYSNNLNMILSSSVSGKYIIGIDTKSNDIYILDIEKQIVLKQLPKSFYPLQIWLCDTSFVYANEIKDSIEFGVYNLKADFFFKMNVISKKQFQEIDDADFLTVPNYILHDSLPFLIFANNNKVYKYFPFKNEKQMLIDLKGKIEKINNIAIDNRGKTLLLAGRNNHIGYLYSINLDDYKLTIIDKGKVFSGDGTYVYFTKNESKCVYYKYVTNTEESKIVQIILYDLNKSSSYILKTYNNMLPTSVIDVPIEKKLFINFLNTSGTIDITASNHILFDVATGLINSFAIEEINY